MPTSTSAPSPFPCRPIIVSVLVPVYTPLPPSPQQIYRKVYFDWDAPRSREGYFRIKGGVDYCIMRSDLSRPLLETWIPQPE